MGFPQTAVTMGLAERIVEHARIVIRLDKKNETCLEGNERRLESKSIDCCWSVLPSGLCIEKDESCHVRCQVPVVSFWSLITSAI